MAPWYIHANMIVLRADGITPSGGYGPSPRPGARPRAHHVLGVLDRVGLTLGLALQALHLPLVPGRQARHEAVPVLLADPTQRLQRDRGHGHPFLKAAASQ